MRIGVGNLIGNLFCLNGHHALHDGKVTRESADERIVASRWSGESHLIGFAAAQHFSVSNDELFGLLVGWDVLVVFGCGAFRGKRGNCSACFEDHHIVPHGRGRELADVLERESYFLSFSHFKCFDAVLHLVVTSDFDRGVFGNCELAESC